MFVSRTLKLFELLFFCIAVAAAVVATGIFGCLFINAIYKLL